MDASASQVGDVAALWPQEEQATSSRSEFVTARIELSKRHWTEVSKPSSVNVISLEEAVNAKLDNMEVFKEWRLHPEWGLLFFKTFGDHFETFQIDGQLDLGEKFSEGAQAEIFDARLKCPNPIYNAYDKKHGFEWVLKVFKEGTLMRELQHQWPEGFFCRKLEVYKVFQLGKQMRNKGICTVYGATLLKDGRFAFLMAKEDEDLRNLVDRKMKESENGCGPFSNEVGVEIMYRMAEGMYWLHDHNIIHRDLKASNVLVKAALSREYLWCKVADFESSIRVVGTRFWKAPKILEARRERNIRSKLELFIREADNYGYGMTCYEVLTGKVPFEDHPLSDQHGVLMDLVIDQHLRPEVPEYVEDWTRKLLHWCWKQAPEERPSFKEIVDFLEANLDSKYIKERLLEKQRGECGDL